MYCYFAYMFFGISPLYQTQWEYLYLIGCFSPCAKVISLHLCSSQTHLHCCYCFTCWKLWGNALYGGCFYFTCCCLSSVTLLTVTWVYTRSEVRLSLFYERRATRFGRKCCQQHDAGRNLRLVYCFENPTHHFCLDTDTCRMNQHLSSISVCMVCVIDLQTMRSVSPWAHNQSREKWSWRDFAKKEAQLKVG